MKDMLAVCIGTLSMVAIIVLGGWGFFYINGISVKYEVDTDYTMTMVEDRLVMCWTHNIVLYNGTITTEKQCTN